MLERILVHLELCFTLGYLIHRAPEIGKLGDGKLASASFIVSSSAPDFTGVQTLYTPLEGLTRLGAAEHFTRAISECLKDCVPLFTFQQHDNSDSCVGRQPAQGEIRTCKQTTLRWIREWIGIGTRFWLRDELCFGLIKRLLPYLVLPRKHPLSCVSLETFLPGGYAARDAHPRSLAGSGSV